MTADASERERARTDVLHNAFVEAGAGTGKTALLVGRIVELLREGVPLGAIAAITFTEKAAAELRDRLRTALAAEPELATHFDDAALTTIHGFARAILAAHPLAAGLPPTFEVVTEIEAAAELQRRYARFADTLFRKDDNVDTVARAVTLGVTRRNLFGLAKALHASRDQLENASLGVPPFAGHDILPLLSALDAVVACSGACLNADDKLLAHVEAVGRLRDELLAASGDQVEELRLVNTFGSVCFKDGQKRAWSAPISKERVQELLQTAETARHQMLRSNIDHVLAVLLERLAEFTREGARNRCTRGRLEFHDLLVEARQLLCTHPTARQQAFARYEHLLVDEFQDTDPLQLDLITLVTSVDDDPAAKRWNERLLVPGSLFVVGDPKQSIYRFRGADVVLYAAAGEIFGGSTPLVLSTNFRTVPTIVNWVNEVIGSLMASRADQAHFAPLVAHRTDFGQPPVEVLGVDEIAGNIELVRAVESDDVAMAIAGIVAAGSRTSFSDVAVLVPARTGLPQLERALESAGVPYRVESKALLYETEEVRTLSNTLRAIDDPTDEVAVLAALRSSAFACSDTELVRWRSAGGGWSPLAIGRADVAPDDPVAAAMAWLAGVHQQRWWCTIAQLIDLIIDQRHLVEVALAHRRPRDRWRRMEFVSEQALAYERAGGRSLRAFVDWLDEQREAGARDGDGFISDLEDDAVRVMTIHAAKGLEFPVVILAGLNTEPSNQAKPLLWDEAGQPQVRLGAKDLDLQSGGYKAAAERDRLLDDNEADRLLYVASTRARDQLVVCLHRKPSNAQRLPAAGRLAPLVASAADLCRPFVVPEPGVCPPSAAPVAPAALDVLPDPIEWRAQRDHLVENLRSSPVVAATSLSTDPGLAPDASDNRPEDEYRPGAGRGRAGSSVGRAVHAVLQTIDLATGEGLADAARMQAQGEGVPAHTDEVTRLVRAVLDTDLVRQVVTGRFWREVLVTAPIGGTVLEGFVDLLVETPDHRLLVVDYKTDAVSSAAEIDGAMAHYRLQGAAYAVALEAQLGRAVDEVMFIFARSPAAAEVRSLPDLDAAKFDVRSALERRAKRMSY